MGGGSSPPCAKEFHGWVIGWMVLLVSITILADLGEAWVKSCWMPEDARINNGKENMARIMYII